MTWFTVQRQGWILETVEIFGFINRDHLVRKFGVSVPQASADLKSFMAENPGKIAYNATAKRYEVNDG
jgi:ABC-type uncharacterized transport system YnjBCD substrate-binding protein